jgi:nucleoside-diphosphate-sugar epimerase
MRVLIIGFGDVAQRLLRSAHAWPQARRIRWFAVTRRAETAAHARSLGAMPILGDLDDLRSLNRLAGLAPYVIYFAPPPSMGETDPRLARALAALHGRARRFVYVSTTGVYGDCRGALIDETQPVNPQSARAKRRVHAEAQLRRRYEMGVLRLRAPGIYAADRLPVERIQRRTPALIESEDSYSNHIHADDLARACWLALFRGGSQRVINAVDGEEIKMGQWFDLVADEHGLPRVPRLPTPQIQASVSPELWSFMRESRRMDGARMRRELRFTPRTLADGIRR